MLECGTIFPGKFSLVSSTDLALFLQCLSTPVPERTFFSYMWTLHEVIPVFMLRDFLELVIVDWFQKVIQKIDFFSLTDLLYLQISNYTEASFFLFNSYRK